MNILFLSHYFPPEVNAPASRTFEHCKCWVEQGHEVTVVTCAPNHPKGEVYDGYRNRLIHREIIDGINVIRMWTFVTANEGFVKRTLNYVSYMVMSILLVGIMPKVDVIISTSPQFFNGLAGYFVSRLKRVPWVLEIRDLWPESIFVVGAIKNRTIIRVLEWLEMFAYRKADCIVPVTDQFKQYMVAKGIDSGKIQVVKNGVDLNFYRSEVDGAALSQQLDLDGKFVAAYFGTHGMAHHLETILEAADLLRENTQIIFIMVGGGAEKQRLSDLKQKLNLPNVLMMDQCPKSMMPELWAIADASLVLLKKSDLFKSVIPSKIFESMAMRTPIVIGVEGESEEIIARACSGLSITPESSQELAAAIERLASDSALCKKFGDNGYAHVVEVFDRKKLAADYSELITQLVASPR